MRFGASGGCSSSELRCDPGRASWPGSSISLVPPELEEGDKVSWTSESRLLITSADNPQFRSKETLVPPETEESATDEAAMDEGSTDGGTTDEATTGGSTDEGATGAGVSPGTTTFRPPDLNTIVRNANTYLYVIESDEVAAYRRREFGELPEPSRRSMSPRW